MNNIKHTTRTGYPGKTFARCAEALKSTALLSEILDKIVSWLPQELHADACFIFINRRDETSEITHTSLEHWYLKNTRHNQQADANKSFGHIQTALYPEVFAALQKQEPVVISIHDQPDLQAATLLKKAALQTCILQPVFRGDEFWGIIGLGQFAAKQWELAAYVALQLLAGGISAKSAAENLQAQLELKTLMHQTAMESFDELRWEFDIASKQLTLYGASPYLRITSNRQLNFNVLKAIQDYVFPADRGRLIHLYVTLLQAAHRTQLQDTFRLMINKEGAFKWVHINLVALPDVSGFAGMVTGKLTAEATEKNAVAIREPYTSKETNFRFVTENISDCITVLNSSGDIIYIAPSSKEVFGVTQDALVNQSLVERIHPQFKETFIRQLLGAGKTSERSKFSYRFRAGDEDYIWIETISRPIVNEQGAVNAYLCINRNINQQFRVLEEAENTIQREKIQHQQQSKVIAESTVQVGLSLDDLQSGLDVLKLYTAVLPGPGNHLFEKQLSLIASSIVSIRQTIAAIHRP